MAVKFVRKHINEGYFNNPEQAKAAKARRAQSSNADRLAKQSKEIFENNLREICDNILLQTPDRNRVKKVTLEDNKIVLDLDYVQADTHTYNVETSFCGSTLKLGFREGKRSAKIELLYDAVAGIEQFADEGSKFVRDRKNILDRTNAYITAAARRMLYKDDAENQPEYEYYKLLTSKPIVVNNLYVFGRYDDVNIYSRKSGNYIFDESKYYNRKFGEKQMYSDEVMDSIGKYFIESYTPANSGEITFRNIADVHIDVLKIAGEEHLKMIVREILEFSYNQYRDTIYIVATREMKKYTRLYKDAETKDTMLERQASTAVTMQKLSKSYNLYANEQLHNSYGSKFKITKAGVVFTKNYVHILDKKTGEMTKKDITKEELNEKYLRYPNAIFYIKYTLDGLFDEIIYFTFELNSLNFYTTGSPDKANHYLEHYNNDEDPIGLASQFIEEEGSTRRAMNSNYYDELKKFKQGTSWLVVKDIISGKLNLI